MTGIITRSLKFLPIAAIAFFCTTTAFAQNNPPLANAGTDIQANEGDFIMLDGTQTIDFDGDPLTFSWTQLSGPAALSFTGTNTATPTLQVPFIGGVGATMTFQLTVSDGQDPSSDTVNVIIKKINRPPVASLIAPLSVTAGAPNVVLDGSGSYDPDLDPLTYTWEQTGGTPVSLNNSTTSTPNFTAPPTTGTVSFRLIVSDGQYNSIATASINVVAANQAPVANAGTNQTVGYGSTVNLTGTATDADGDTLTYAWTQTAGPSVSLTGADTQTPSFVAPSTTATLTFSLVANDGKVDSTASTVNVYVFPAAAIPNCANAHPNRKQLWPPNRTMARVRICGFESVGCDSDDDADDPSEDIGNVQVRVTAITQDEPTTGTGSGDTAVDAAVQSTRPNGDTRLRDLILLKKERSDTGNGRVYEVSFTATNLISNSSCTGKVQVCVPTKTGNQGQCTNSGQNYDSFH